MQMTTLRPQMLFRQLRREPCPLHLLRQETLLLPQLQRHGLQTSGLSQKAHL